MISVSTTYNNLIENGGQYEWQILNGTEVIDISHLMSGTITSTQYEKFSVGNCIASQLELTLWDVAIDTTEPLEVQFRATDGTNTSEWYTKGIFYVDTVETSPYSEVTKVTAFDAMLKAEVIYMKEGTWTSRTDYQVLTGVSGQYNGIVDDLGVSLSSAADTYFSANAKTLTIAPSIGDSGTTERELLSGIGVLHGCNFIINSVGELDVIFPFTTPTNTAAVGDAVVDFDASPSETVSKVRVWKSGGTYFRKPDLDNDSVTDAQFEALAGLCLDIDCPLYASQEVADDLYTLAEGYINYPYTASGAYVDPKYEVGDGITIKDVTSVIANQTISIDPLAASDLSIEGEEVLQSHYPYINPITKEVARSEARTTASISVLEGQIQTEVTERTTQGASLAQDISDNANALQNAINSTNATVSELSSSLTQTATEINATITSKETQLQTYADNAADTAADDLAATLATYIRYYQSGGTGVLELGDTASGYTARLNNQKLSFYDGETEVAYISNNKLYINNGQITGDLQIGKYQWITDSTGRMSLKWVG